jgi:hypothetical protein
MNVCVYDFAVANGYFTLSKSHHQTSEFIFDSLAAMFIASNEAGAKVA